MLGHRDDVLAQMDADSTLANAKGAHGIPIMYHIALSGDVTFADEVVARGGGDGIDRCLHAAVGKGHEEMVKWLLGKGAALDGKDFRDKTPLELAEELNHTEIAALLRQASEG